VVQVAHQHLVLVTLFIRVVLAVLERLLPKVAVVERLAPEV
jgi:hypothetical protein